MTPRTVFAAVLWSLAASHRTHLRPRERLPAEPLADGRYIEGHGEVILGERSYTPSTAAKQYAVHGQMYRCSGEQL